uniref:Putative Cytochrome P450 71D11 n=1 Tax=Aegilops tauschii TaxID=37682 RepID=M8AUG0_AEGTA
MDASHPSYLLFLAILVFIPLAYFTLSARRQAGLRLPPGPWALPIIGHLHHMMGKLPHHRVRDLAQLHGPLMLLRLGGLPLVVASSAEAAHEVMRTHDIVFATRPISRTMKLILVDGSEGLIFAPYGSAWRQLRKICTVELLSARRVQSFRGIRQQEVQHLLQAVASTPSPSAVNLGTLLSTYVNDSTVRAIIGSRFKDRETFLRLMEEGIELFSRLGLPDLYPSSRLAMLVSRMPRRMKRQSQAMMAFMETVIQEHRVPRAACDKEEDLVDVLLRIQNQDDHLEFPLTTDNIKAVMAVSYDHMHHES